RGWIFFGAALRERTAEQFAGTDGVEEPFAGERVDPRGGVADQRPVLADHVALRKRALLRRGQDVAVKLCVVCGDVLSFHERLQVSAKFRAGMYGHAATDSDREVVTARKGPDVTFKLR